jgi:hypothetical protein
MILAIIIYILTAAAEIITGVIDPGVIPRQVKLALNT